MESQGLTTKELGFVEDLIKACALKVTKLESYERETQDGQLQDLCRRGIQAHNRQMDELLSLLR
jgi:hypothetical protein